MAIRILVTGGTFDKEYNEHTGELFFKDTHIAEMLRLGRSRVEVTIRTIMMVDSLDMTDTDRALIVQNCLRSEEDRIVITHGTDTMTETAAAIARNVLGKTVVLTGAMIPYAFGSSDGLFNLGSALSFVQVLPAGVYIAMNGQCFIVFKVEWRECYVRAKLFSRFDLIAYPRTHRYGLFGKSLRYIASDRSSRACYQDRFMHKVLLYSVMRSRKNMKHGTSEKCRSQNSEVRRSNVKTSRSE